MAQSNYHRILTSVQTITSRVLVLSSTASGVSISNVGIRRLPKASETIDSLPLVAICPDDKPEKVVQLSFENLVEVHYAVEIVVIAPMNRDYSTNIDQYFIHREYIRQAFQEPLLEGVPAVYDTDVNPDLPIDRSKLNQNYAYSGIGVVFKAVEERTRLF